MLKDNEVAIVRLDNRGLWTVDKYVDDSFDENIGGSYPKSHHCVLDAGRKWGRSIEVRVTRLRSVDAVERWLESKSSK